MIILHDHLSPDRVVLVERIDSAVPYGSGSLVNGEIGVHESPEEIEKILDEMPSE